MGLLKKIFGGGDPLAAVNRSVQRQQWADALRVGAAVDRDRLPAHLIEELDARLALAGNQVAETNLDEGEACQRAGDAGRALEHYLLANQHARSEELKQRAAQLCREIQNTSAEIEMPVAVASSCCSSGCGSADEAQAAPENADNTADWDIETRFELTLSSYPPEWAERYAGSGDEFKRAVLMSHEGRLSDALIEFDAVPGPDRDDLFYFERGSLRIRMNEQEQGRADLEQALVVNPRQELALETLVTLDLADRNLAAAESRLNSMLSAGVVPAFCYSRLAMIAAGRNEEASAMAYGEKALASGPVDLESLVLQSSLLEKNGRLDEAEALLASLPAGGCGGGAHVLLAEFWLRRGKFTEKALESFKGASRQEPGNPRWPMRIAQAYLALGWHKEGHALMKKVLSTPGLEEHLRKEAEEILIFYGK